MAALTTQRHRSELSELDRIDSDPESRALFLAGLDAAIAERATAEVAELEAFADAVELAAETLQAVIRPNGERAA
ncbi:hypothetical protein [Streptomyces sp. NPDC059651]|uniref:hypothetical protein n=1 Tax=Streptomyces sp. NPDC059651 TaxID=3346897 RepID=UPI0036B1750A